MSQTLRIAAYVVTMPVDLKYLWDDELTDREIFCIGKIVAQWGALEYQVFHQTLATFVDSKNDDISLPKEMNNLQFSGVLNLWKERIVDKATGKRGKVLLQQYEAICELKSYRDAIVHGMWQWSATDLTDITSIRIRKKDVVSVRFNADDLADFCLRVSQINFKLLFPTGSKDRIRKMSASGGYFSRRGLALFTGHPLAGEWVEERLKKS